MSVFHDGFIGPRTAKAIIDVVFLAVTVLSSQVRAQTIATTETPLSFYGLANNQAIEFTVSSKPPHGGATFLSFGVEVSDQPQPEAKIRLWINASMLIPRIEKEWGHRVDEQITRSLTSTDLQALEKFLTDARSRGSLPPPALSGHPATAFSLITHRMTKEGYIASDVDKTEYYAPSEEAEASFIKNFIGFK